MHVYKNCELINFNKSAEIILRFYFIYICKIFRVKLELIKRSRNLVEHYTKSLLYELELTSRVLHESMLCYFKQKEFEITPDEYIILDCLYMNPNIIQMELAKMILKGRAHTGKFLKSLEKKGMITRTPIQRGATIVMKLEITTDGLEIYNKISNEILSYIKRTSVIPKAKIDDTINMLKAIREDALNRFNIKFD